MGHGLMEHDSLFSVRQPPWHGLGKVLETPPATVAEALELSGLGWEVDQDQVYCAAPVLDVSEGKAVGEAEGRYYIPEAEAVFEPVEGFRLNRRMDTREILGVVSDDYRIVQNVEAFKWLEALLGGDLEWETAGSLRNGRRVWILVTPGELVEVGGDPTQLYIYCSNSHDGSQAVVAASTKVRIVCANTLGWAEREAMDCPRTYRFRHTGDLQLKLDEARRVMGIALDWDAAFKEMGDKLAQQRMSVDRFDKKVVTPFVGLDDPALEGRKIALRNREDKREVLLETFRGNGPEGDTSGNSPGTKWCAANALAEFCDFGRRYTTKTDQVQRSFEDQALKQRGLDLVLTA